MASENSKFAQYTRDQLFAFADKCAKDVLDTVKDERLRDLIFGDDWKDRDEFMNSSGDIMRYTSSLLMLAFHYVYFRYRDWVKIDNKVDNGPADNDLIRIFNIMYRLYFHYDLNFELMDNLLTDLQIDLALNGVVTREFDLQNEIESDNLFAETAYYARCFRRSRQNDPNRSDFALYEYMDAFRRLVDKTFPFLNGLETELRPLDTTPWTAERGGVQHCPRVAALLLKNTESRYTSEKFWPDRDFASEHKIETFCCVISVSGYYYFLTNIELIAEGGSLLSLGDWLNAGADDHLTLVGYKLNYRAFSERQASCALIVGPHMSPKPGKYGKYVYYLDTPLEEFGKNFIPELIASVIGDSSHKTSRLFFEDFYSINYKYIRNLSLAVVDVIKNNKSFLKKLFDDYKDDERFARLFGQMSSEPEINLYSVPWDIIIAILLISDGAAKLLQTVLKYNDSCFEKLIGNLQLRFGKSRFDQDEARSRAEAEFAAVSESIRSSYGLSEKEADSLRREIRARTIVSLITSTEAVDETKGFPLSIRARIEQLKDIGEPHNTASNESKVKTAKLIVNQTLSTLVLFYRGFLEYAQIKLDFESDSAFRVLDDTDIAGYHASAQRAFDATREKLAATEPFNCASSIGDSFVKIMAELKKLCDDCAIGAKYYPIVKACLGRDQLLDYDFLEEKLYCIEAIPPCPDNAATNAFLEDVIFAFRYLQTGEKTKAKQANVDLSLKAIFPYVATYQYTKHTGDGYRINCFSIIDHKGFDTNVQVLSEFDFILNEKYYCLPNRRRSSEQLNLWIEPTLIYYMSSDAQKSNNEQPTGAEE